MPKNLRERDQKLLETIIQEDAGFIDRESAVQAFYRAGARVGNIYGHLHVVFGTRQIPICHGKINLATPHETFRNALKQMAMDVLKYKNIKAKQSIPSQSKKHLGTSVLVNIPI